MSPPASAPRAIAWLAGRWDSPDALAIPLSDRGLLLADGLFETVLVEAGQPRLLAEHLERWHEAAALLAMAPPPGPAALEPLIHEAVARAGVGACSAALRLNWSRGSGGANARGLDLPAPGGPPLEHRFWLQLTPTQPAFQPLTAITSRQERRNADSLLSRCKSFAYGPAIQARHEARRAGADDALLLSTTGELCCATAANLLVRRTGRWLTPPLSSGCLPGIMRRRALELGLAQEARIKPASLPVSTGRTDPASGTGLPSRTPPPGGPDPLDGAVLLLNSLGCRPLAALDGQPLPLWPDPEGLWRSLLSG
ncbi:aminotransferase class IV [Vulcanococcus limneticus]|uniref:aminotransferase class IV n=1 Tax=Vulcanococcus limneticus TaxID=2170428 RepID=UPI00398BC86A